MNWETGLKVVVIQAVLASSLFALQEPGQSTAPAPDNTKTNERDRNSGPTADQQSNDPNDRSLAQQIRQSLVKDKSLSTYAQNVKVIVQGGQVTLKGPVRSEDEKKAVEAKAVQIAGDGKVTNQLDVAPSK
jgi:osmotically-inducible protein OsmY